MSKIVFLLIGDVQYDGRVRKEIHSLKTLGHELILIESESKTLLPTKNELGAEVYLLKRKRGGNCIIRFFRIVVFYVKLINLLRKIRPDYIHCNDINTLIFSAYKLKNVKYIYDAHELRFGNPGVFSDIPIMLIESILARRCDSIIVPQIDRLNLMSIKYRISKNKMFLLENFPNKLDVNDENYFLKKYGRRIGGKKIVSYIGGITNDRYLEDLILAFKKIDQCVLFIIGYGPIAYVDYLRALVEKERLTNVYLEGPIPHSEVLWASASSNIGVCFYNPVRFNSYFSASNKLFELLNLGVNILSNYSPATSKVCNSHNSVLLHEVNCNNIANAICKLEKMANEQKGEFYWEKQENVLEIIYPKC